MKPYDPLPDFRWDDPIPAPFPRARRPFPLWVMGVVVVLTARRFVLWVVGR